MPTSTDETRLLQLLRDLKLPDSALRPPNTSLTGAACDGDVALAQAFIDAGADIEEKSIGYASAEVLVKIIDVMEDGQRAYSSSVFAAQIEGVTFKRGPSSVQATISEWTIEHT